MAEGAKSVDVRIKEQGDCVRQLKADQAEKSAVDAAVKLLQELKAEKAKSEGKDPAEASGSSKSGGSSKKGKNAITLKVPKGTKDHVPSEMLLRNSIFESITNVFKLHGGVTIDTPVFELKEILSGKYGEDSKLIYDLQDQGGELCSLRYDLTVPFARFLAMNGSTYQNIKRYHIAKVYRRDNPAMTKGRMREFYQCDFDIAGSYDPMVPDAEILKIIVQVFDSLQIGDFTIKVNHRKILDGIFAVCGVPQDKIRTISSAVDKLDKSPWSEVKTEMTQEKGLDESVADKIGEYVKLKGSEELLERLQQDATLTANASASQGLKDMQTLFSYLKAFRILPKISFDMSLARGLDYYTGIIYECVVEGSAPPGFKSAEATPAVPQPDSKQASAKKEDGEVDESQVGVGSVAAGGRYDDLVGMFSGAKGDKGKIPCVGISFGVERIFSILQQRAAKEEQKLKMKEVDAYIMAMGDGLLVERMTIADQLWEAGIKTEFSYKAKPKTAAQWDAIDRDSIPFVVIVAPDEWKQGQVRVKQQVGKDAGGENKGEVVSVQQLTSYLKEKLSA